MLVKTQNLTQDGRLTDGTFFPSFESHQTYCGLDCCLTLEILDKVSTLHPAPSIIYDFERALQGPYLEIMQRGFLVDQLSRQEATRDLRLRIDHLQDGLNQFSQAIWGRPLNPRSQPMLQKFFYQELHLPEIWISQKGVRKLSLNREVLEKLDDYLFARPFVSSILAIRDLTKQLQVFETDIDADGRFRASYNIAGTETGRPSSSENAYGTGGNAQNIAAGLRYVFVADPGRKIAVIDLEQVEARDVGFFCGCLFDDWTFLNACESGDLHTNNAKLIWPERPWTGDAKRDRLLAEENFYREFSFRDMSKRGGHLSNYYGTAWTAARSLKVPLPIMEEFQARYVRGRPAGIGRPAIIPAYPCISRWWQWTAEQIQTTQSLTTPFGRERHFFGRPGDDTTLREAIAFMPQSTTADRMNLGMWRVWKEMPEVRLLAQTYDSITFDYDPNDEERVLEKALKLIEVELVAPNGRRYVVPGEAKIGWNWGAEITEEDQVKARANGTKPPKLNYGGLKKWKRGSTDSRVRAVGLQRIM